MTTEIATVGRTGRAMIVADALVQEAEQRALLGEYVAQHMTEGTDFGVIPGTKNKTLLKPGAEKLTQLFRCVPQFTIEEKVENWETGLFFYRFGCRVVTQADGTVVAEGVGSCSTYESRYRWRTADRKCPACGKECIKRSKFPPKNDPQAVPGWYCFGKIGGCGANFAHDDPAIADQPTGRQQNPDLIDSVNTVLKMAKKRALVDAAIALARCSDIFAQDVEDVPGDPEPDPPRKSAPKDPPKQLAPNPPAKPTKPEPSKLPKDGAELLTRLQKYDAKLSGQKQFPPGDLLKYVSETGAKRGFGKDVAAWGPDAIKASPDIVNYYGDTAKQTLDADALADLCEAKGRTVEDVLTWHNTTHGTSYPADVEWWRVSVPHRPAMWTEVENLPDDDDETENPGEGPPW